jgi:hypothetical protein
MQAEAALIHFTLRMPGPMRWNGQRRGPTQEQSRLTVFVRLEVSNGSRDRRKAPV